MPFNSALGVTSEPMRATYLLFMLAVSGAANAQGSADVTLKTSKTAAPPHSAIAYLTEGPAFGHTDGAVRGRFYRVLFVRVGLAYDFPLIRIESLTYGDEGCCMRLRTAWELNLEEPQAIGVTLPNAATSELRFVDWTSPHSFNFKVGNLTCSISGLGKTKAKLACAQ